MADLDLDELADELADFAPAKSKQAAYTPRQERIIAGFEDIERFFEEHGRLPQHGEQRDIFERLYAVRLDRLRQLEECRSLLAAFDKHGLLDRAEADAPPEGELDADALAAELSGFAEGEDITLLRHVSSAEEKRAAEEIAHREKCADFDKFKPLFAKVQQEIETGVRNTRPFVRDAGFQKADIKAGDLFILGGQTAYVAAVGEPIKAPNGETDARLRVIYSNGTESDLLLRSLQRALYKDEGGRRISEPEAGPLFADRPDEGETETGTIYVLRSKSDHPVVAERREIIHKIGVTGGDLKRRLANAKLDPTFLMAEVEVLATYELYNINRARLENLIHRIFAPARLDIAFNDRFGKPVIPREWFLVPLFVIDEAIAKIRDGTITGYRYDPAQAALVRVE